MACTAFFYDSYPWVITALLLLLPFLDRTGSANIYTCYKNRQIYWSVVLLISATILYFNPAYWKQTINIILFVGLPEEWFFRYYFMSKMQRLLSKPVHANILTSVFFTLVHVQVQGFTGLLVFFPSIIFGYIYLKNKDLLLVVLVHSLSNIIYYLYLDKLFLSYM